MDEEAISNFSSNLYKFWTFEFIFAKFGKVFEFTFNKFLLIMYWSFERTPCPDIENDVEESTLLIVDNFSDPLEFIILTESPILKICGVLTVML